MQQLMRRLMLFFVLMNFFISVFAQTINDSLVLKIAKRFEKVQHLSLQKIVKPAVLRAGQMPEKKMPCYPGKQVTIVAIFAFKPVEAYGRMLVMKRFDTAVKYDEHFFQNAGYDKSFNVYYSLLSVYFPQEATFKNCNTVLQVYDKQKPSNKVWLAILTK